MGILIVKDQEMNTEKKSIRYEWVMAIVIFLVLIGLSMSFLHDRISYFSDSKVYLKCAESLSSGKGYAHNGMPEATWPPVYSILLSALMFVGVDNIASFKIMNILMGLLALVFWWRHLRCLSDRMTGVLVVFASGVFFPWIYYSHAILAEMLLVLFVSLFFYSAYRYVEKEKTSDLAWMTFAAMMAPVTKMAGVAFLFGWVYVVFLRDFRILRLIIRKQWRILFVLLTAVIALITPLGIWCIRNWLLTGSPTGYELGITSEYLYSIEKIGVTDPTLLKRILIAVRGYSHILLIPDQTGIARIGNLPVVVNVACVSISLAVIIGWIRALTIKMHRIGALFFALYGGLLILNSWYDIRYLLPIIPLYFFYLADGIVLVTMPIVKFVTARFPALSFFNDESLPRRIMLAVFIFAFCAFTIFSPQARRLRSPQYGTVIQRLYKACEFVRNSQTMGNMLVAGGAGFVPLWSGRKVVSLLGRLDEDRALISFDIPDNVGFLLLTESKFAPYREKYMEPLVEANTNRLTEVFRDGETVVYRVVR